MTIPPHLLGIFHVLNVLTCQPNCSCTSPPVYFNPVHSILDPWAYHYSLCYTGWNTPLKCSNSCGFGNKTDEWCWHLAPAHSRDSTTPLSGSFQFVAPPLVLFPRHIRAAVIKSIRRNPCHAQLHTKDPHLPLTHRLLRRSPTFILNRKLLSSPTPARMVDTRTEHHEHLVTLTRDSHAHLLVVLLVSSPDRLCDSAFTIQWSVGHKYISTRVNAFSCSSRKVIHMSIFRINQILSEEYLEWYLHKITACTPYLCNWLCQNRDRAF